MTYIRKPYLLLIGDSTHPLDAKTAFGLRDWARSDCVGQLRFSTSAVDIGLPDMSPCEAVSAGARTMVVGIAPMGGSLPPQWYEVIRNALHVGLDIASGLHHRLRDIPEIADYAAQLKRLLHDVRHSDSIFPVGTGARRAGKRLLTVGTDCALGKKYTALALAKEMAARGLKVDFRATGQTGILISGTGVALDAVVADFVSGAAESLSPANDPVHWDIIEGQGSLLHPGYAAVTLGLLHGSQPDALVMCHDPMRTHLMGNERFPCPRIVDAMTMYVQAGRLTNPRICFIGVSMNTAAMAPADAQALMAATSAETNLPCVDPIRTGVGPIVDALVTAHAS